MKIALAFSGGGVRATVFHLGVLARLAREDLLGNVETISSVSGGSLAVGLVFSAGGNRWPTSAEFLHNVVPEIHRLLTTTNLQWSYAVKSLLKPWRLLSGRATILGDELERQWGIEGNLADLPVTPRWLINATCYQTGKNWRFQRDQMGDYLANYVRDPDFRLSHALATSAAVPGLIGPLVIRSRKYRWSAIDEEEWSEVEPQYKRLHLWDGGVYDNLGVESLFKPGEGLRGGTDFLMVCDASRPLAQDARKSGWNPELLKATFRLIDVATDQVRSVRARTLMDYFIQNPGSGVYLRLGLHAKRLYERVDQNHVDVLSKEDVKRASTMETTLRQLQHGEFSLLFRHGYEVADSTLAAYCQDVLEKEPRSQIQFHAA